VTGRHRAAELAPRVRSLREVIAVVSDRQAGGGGLFPGHGWQPVGSADLGCRVLSESVLAQLLARTGARHPGDTGARLDPCATVADSAASRAAELRVGVGTTGERR
jgi:hypothetical protein